MQPRCGSRDFFNDALGQECVDLLSECRKERIWDISRCSRVDGDRIWFHVDVVKAVFHDLALSIEQRCILWHVHEGVELRPASMEHLDGFGGGLVVDFVDLGKWEIGRDQLEHFQHIT